MENEFPKITVTIKGEGKEKEADQDFFKECSIEIQQLINRLHSGYQDEKKWVEHQLEQHPNGYSPFGEQSPFYEKFSQAYTEVSLMVSPLPRIEDITEAIIKGEISEVENTMDVCLQKKYNDIGSQFEHLSQINLTYEDHKKMEFNDLYQLMNQITRYAKDTFERIVENYQLNEYEIIKSLVVKNLLFYRMNDQQSDPGGVW